MRKQKDKHPEITIEYDEQLTRAFCLGDERQQITEAHLVARSKNDFSKFLLRAKAKDLPSIIKPNVTELSLTESI